MNKPCKTCGMNKLLSEFDRHPSGKYGRQAHCKECRTEMRDLVKRDLSDLEGEIWVDIIGWEGYYKISNKSRLKRLPRRLIDVTGRHQNLREKIMTPVLCTTTNYELVDLQVNGRELRTSLHRLVGIHFIPNSENKPEINHKNGIRNDNRIDNLEWATSSEQKLHAFRVLKRTRSKAYSKNPHLIENRKGAKAPNARKIIQMDMNGNYIEKYGCIKDAVDAGAAKDNSMVSKCCRGKSNSHNNYKWEYA